MTANPNPAPAARKKPAKRAKAPKELVGFARGKRKEAIARAVVRKGKGQFFFNTRGMNAVGNRVVRELVTEPLRFCPDVAANVDVSVTAIGGGEMGQAQAARTAVARALVEYTHDDSLKQKMVEADRYLFAEDYRRVEPKKYKGPKARARFQKSYR